MPWQLEDPLNWNLITRRQLQIQTTEGEPNWFANPNWTGKATYKSIEAVNLQTPYRVLAVGIDSNSASKHWRYAGEAQMFLPGKVSSTQKINSRTLIKTEKLRLFHLNFLVFPAITLDQFEVQINFNYWIYDALLEVWFYDGQIPTVTQTGTELTITGDIQIGEG